MNPFNFDIETMNNKYTDGWPTGYQCHICGFWMQYGRYHICSYSPFSTGTIQIKNEKNKKLKEDLHEVHEQINKAIIKIVEIQNELEKEAAGFVLLPTLAVPVYIVLFELFEPVKDKK